MESQLEMNEIERLRKSAPPHTGTVALTCVFWVICGQCKPFNSLCIGVRLTTLRTRTHTHTVLQWLMQRKLLTHVKDLIAEAVTGQDVQCSG